MAFFTREMNPYLPLDAGEHGVTVAHRDSIPFGTQFSLVIREGLSKPRLWNYKGDYTVHSYRPLLSRCGTGNTICK